VPLPQAMDLLIDWHRQLKGEHANWDEYREKMREEQRVIVRINIEKVGPNKRG
ncbi:MAG: PPOX class F420-dependent oxidoreductase, partial [Candidatus Latescibacteria bacterium]|nr:PPOX class F420-dependent oxidoreductase [Candidatus Latescibacterota bacterium]